MSKRIGVFVDISNLYYCINLKFKGRKLDYKAYYDFIADLGDVQQALAYGAQVDNEAASFIYCIKEIGFTPKYKKPKAFHGEGTKLKRKADWDVGIVIDVISMVDRLDLVILGTADGDLEPLVSWLRQKGIDVIIVACGISRELKESATKFIEVPESLLEQSK